MSGKQQLATVYVRKATACISFCKESEKKKTFSKDSNSVHMLRHGCEKYSVSGENREKVCLLHTL
jgi:hypothetical protein